MKHIAIQDLKPPESGHQIFILCDNKKDNVDQAIEKLGEVCTSIESNVKEGIN